jgi:hypothetical protein
MPVPNFTTLLPDFKIVEVEAGGQLPRVGLIGLLTVDTNIYRPVAFGGGIETALPVNETAAWSSSFHFLVAIMIMQIREIAEL